jgi:hypothetical protein
MLQTSVKTTKFSNNHDTHLIICFYLPHDLLSPQDLDRFSKVVPGHGIVLVKMRTGDKIRIKH